MVCEGVGQLGGGLRANPLLSGSEIHTYFPGLDSDPVSQCEESCSLLVTHTFPKNAGLLNEEFLYIWILGI